MEEKIREEEVETPKGAEEVTGNAAEEVTEEGTEEQESEAQESKEVNLQAPPKKTAQERIGELTRLRREAEREREYWRRVALDKTTPAEPKVATAKVEDIPNTPPRPNLENFETSEEYEEALVDWKLDIRDAKKRAEQEKAERSKSFEKFQKEADKLRAEYDDFDKVIESPVFTPHMRDAILVSNMGPMLAYHLGRPENQQLAETISRLPATVQILEIGRIESNLSLSQKQRKASGAPPPINPVGGTGAITITDDSRLSDDEWFKKQQQKRLDALKQKYSGG